MANRSPCQSETIAEANGCVIQKCSDCGVYHLHVGPVTLRLRPEIFDNLCTLMARLQVTNTTRTAVIPGPWPHH